MIDSFEFPDPTTATRKDVETLLGSIKSGLQNLPLSLPTVNADASPFAEFLCQPFQLNPEKLEHTGSEVATLGEHLELAFGWKSRTTGDGVIKIAERGRAICAVHDVVDAFFRKYPEDNTLKKWIIDIARGIRAVVGEHEEDVMVSYHTVCPTCQITYTTRQCANERVTYRRLTPTYPEPRSVHIRWLRMTQMI
jgi:hypothetical protein